MSFVEDDNDFEEEEHVKMHYQEQKNQKQKEVQRTQCSSSLLNNPCLDEVTRILERLPLSYPRDDYSKIQIPNSEEYMITQPHIKKMKGIEINEDRAKILDSRKGKLKGKRKAAFVNDGQFSAEKSLPLNFKNEFSETLKSENGGLRRSKKNTRRELKLKETEDVDTDEDKTKKKKKIHRCSRCNITLATHRVFVLHMIAYHKNQKTNSQNMSKFQTIEEDDEPTHEEVDETVKVAHNARLVKASIDVMSLPYTNSRPFDYSKQYQSPKFEEHEINLPYSIRKRKRVHKGKPKSLSLNLEMEYSDTKKNSESSELGIPKKKTRKKY